MMSAYTSVRIVELARAEAMHQLTKLLAKNCGPVRVNCVAPGLIETRITAGNATRMQKAMHEGQICRWMVRVC